MTTEQTALLDERTGVQERPCINLIACWIPPRRAGDGRRKASYGHLFLQLLFMVTHLLSPAMTN